LYRSFQIFLAGKSDAEDTAEMLNVIRDRLIPNRVFLLIDPEKRDNILFRKNMIVDKLTLQNGQATAVVCQHHACSLPITDPSELASQLNNSRSPDL